MARNKILIFGAGRMGLSHAAMIGLIDSNSEICFYEPSFKNRIFIRLLSGKSVSSIRNIRNIDYYSHAIIASPPNYHNANYQLLTDMNFRGKIFIEKPISIDSDEITLKFYSGYVLQHNYFIKRILNEVKNDFISNIDIKLRTNQDFAANSLSWRMSKTSPEVSFLNEFGSHCINLALRFSFDQDFIVTSAKKNNIILDSLNNKNSSRISLIGKDSNVRKSVFLVKIESSKFIYETDLYYFKKYNHNMELIESSSLASEGMHASAYLRGIDFAVQMEEFLSNNEISETDIKTSLKTDKHLTSLTKAYL